MSESVSDQEQPAPLSDAALLAIGIVLGFANFTAVLDMTIANVSIPHIASGLAVSPTQGTLVITSYAVAEAIVVPLNGWLVGRFGGVRCFIWATLAFGLFSFLCGLATTFETLVLFRVLQGFAGGLLMPLTQTLLMHIFPREKHASALSIWGTTIVCGPALGPIIGGVISDNWSWRWIFLVNVPVTLIGATLAWRMLKGRDTETARVPIDYVGLVLLVVWVGALQLMLDKGRELDWFGSPFIVTLGLIAAVGFAVFLIWELTDPNPVVDLRVFGNRPFAAATAAQCAAFGAFFTSIVLVPLWLQTNLGYTATHAGYATAIGGFASLTVVPFAGRLLGKFDPRLVVSCGMLWMGLFALERTQSWSSGIDFWQAAMPQLLTGFGTPFFFFGATAIALAWIEPKQVASAVGVMNFFRTLTGAVAAAVATTYWEHAEQANHAALAGILNSPGAAMATLEKSGLSRDQALAQINRIVTNESVTLATTQLFWITTAVFAAAAAMVWLVPRPRPHGGSANAVH